MSLNTAGNNTAVGAYSLSSNTAGTSNTALGYTAGSSITAGTSNTALGYNAGSSITTGSTNIAIGDNANVPSGIASNQIAIGTNLETMYIQGGFNYYIDTTTIIGATILTGVLKQFYKVDTPAGTYNIDLPYPAPEYIGSIVYFRRVGGIAPFTTIFFQYNAPAMNVVQNGFTVPSVTASLGPTATTTAFICDGFAWYQVQ